MFGLQKRLESTIEEMVESGDFNQIPNNELESIFLDMIPGLVDDTANLTLVSIKRDAPSGLKRHQKDRRGFDKRLQRRWKHPLDLLDLIIALTVEVGTEFNRKFRNDAIDSGGAVFEALLRLHSRACQVSGEVLVLLHAGFADGAHARWRSLHEIAVVSSLIQKHDSELAARYLLHETIQQYKLACEHKKICGELGVEFHSKENFDSLKVQRGELITKFGGAFKNEYGWASAVIGKDSPNMRDIEQYVQLDHMRSYYRMASDNVHPNSHGAYFRLGLHSSQQDQVLLAGPSNWGLAEPRHATAISLLQTTTDLLSTKPDFDCLVTMKILGELTNDVGRAFLKAHDELDALGTDVAQS